MIRRFAGVLSLSLALSTAILNPSVAAISGSKCTKVGTTKTASSIKYTCVKQGNKLVWNKGAAVKPNVKPSPTPSPDLVNTVVHVGDSCTASGEDATRQTSAGTLICKKDLSGNLRWDLPARPTSKPTPSASPVSSPVKSVEIDPIRLEAFKSTHDFKCGTSHPNISFTKDVGPNFDPKIAANIDNLLDRDFNCFNNYLPGPIKLKVFYVSQSDTEFAKTSVNPYLTTNEANHLKEILDRMAAGDWGNGGMAGGFVNWAKDHSYTFFVIHVTDNFIWEEKENKLISHEFTHVLQDVWREKINTPAEEDWIRQSPGYFTEGGAEALGYTFEATSALALETNMKKAEKGMSGHPDAGRFRNVASETEMLARIKETIFPKDEVTSSLQYPIGGLIGEYLIGKYGFTSYLTLIKNLGTFADFSDNLKSVIGLTQDQMLEAAAPYVFKQWKSAMQSS